mgnify:CR=1 FL=1
MSSQNGHVLVIGASGIDIKAMPHADLLWGADNLGRIRNSVGGVARNIAENLARLDVPTILLTAVGRDPLGQRILRQTRAPGVNCQHVRRVTGEPTGNHVALLKQNGDLDLAVSDFGIIRYVDPAYLIKHRPLFAEASMVVIDVNMTEEALETVFALARDSGVRVCADPTSPTLASKLIPYLNDLFLVTPNAAETSALCGVEHSAYDRDTALDAALRLVALGADIAVVTLGEAGLAYADANGSGYIRAVRANIVDSTGAGDAFTGAVIFGLLNDVPVDEAMRLGVTAAALTLQTSETVVPELSQELLYARLVV